MGVHTYIYTYIYTYRYRYTIAKTKNNKMLFSMYSESLGRSDLHIPLLQARAVMSPAHPPEDRHICRSW